jgi:adenylosuccinate lyase
MNEHEVYDNPLIVRYASRQMARLWSPQEKFSTWRRLWVALAEAQNALGLAISEEQIGAMRGQVDAIDFAAAERYERRFRHDVMAHIHAYGDAAPTARPIIHLGATSCYVTDNADLIVMRAALRLVRDKAVAAIDALADFADRHKTLPCLGYTHFQPAQLVTVGKRATLWCYELILDLLEIERRIAELKFLGVKGTTGTQASFLELFDGDDARVDALDRMVADAFGFERTYPVSGQTYSRKVDAQVLAAVAGIGESAHRFGTDLRLLAHEREVEEPFEAQQIGSSAMAYKRNPMRAERMCSLSRFVMALPAVAGQTAATQWLERTLDDSAVRRLTVPQAFLAVDAILNLYLNVVPGLVVHPSVIALHVAEELPFMATENLLMAAVQAGGDRQDLHERIRVHAMAAANRLKDGAGDNDLLDRIRSDPAFPPLDFQGLLEPRRYIGRSEQQVDAFLAQEVEPIRRRYPDRRAEDPASLVRV